MPTLRILTWNSKGESQEKAAQLYQIIGYLTMNGWRPDVVFVQEANNGGGGPIMAMLNGIGLFPYVAWQPEGGAAGPRGGKAYLMAAGPSVTIASAFNAVPLNSDGGVVTYINNMPGPARGSAQMLAAQYRSIGVCGAVVGGTNVALMTWHAPRGVNPWTAGIPGGADAFAFLLLERSNTYAAMVGQPVAVIAADLNIREDAIGMPVQTVAGPFNILNDWQGFGFHLDFVLGNFNGIPGAVVGGFDFQEARGPGLSDHPVVGGEIQW